MIPRLRGLLGGAGMRRVWAAIFVLLLVWVLAAALSQQPRGPTLGLDKANHVAAFAALAMSGLLAGRGRAGQVEWLAAGLLGLGIAIEIAQWQIPGRSAELLDVLADAAGIAIGLALGAALSRRRADAGSASPPPAR